jgi:repressor LexA
MNRIKFLREEKNMLQEDLGKVIGVTQKTISNYEKGTRDIPTEYVLKLADYFNVSTDYLLGKSMFRNPEKEEIIKGIMAANGLNFKNIDELNSNADGNAFPTTDIPLKLPVLGKISAGLPILAQENIEGYEFAPSSFIKEDFDYFYLKVSGDSMNLKFPEGNLVLVQKQPTLENGEIGVILVGDNEATVKKYRCENDLVILEPMSTNPDHTTQIYNPKNIDIKIIGKVILHLGKV